MGRMRWIRIAAWAALAVLATAGGGLAGTVSDSYQEVTATITGPDGVVTEGTSSSAFIVDAKGVVRTQPLGPHILSGVTRRAILRLARGNGVTVEERPFSVEEAYAAREAFMTAASAFVLPIVSIDGRRIGNGEPGSIACAFRVTVGTWRTLCPARSSNTLEGSPSTGVSQGPLPPLSCKPIRSS